MSESDSFISEVTEEVRKDRLFAYWRKYGAVLIGGIVVIVGATWWWTWQRQEAQVAARELGGRFAAAEAAGGAAPFGELAAALEGPAASVARLREAAALAAAGDAAGAVAIWRAVAEDGALDAAYRDVARLAAAQSGAGLTLEERTALLEPAVQPGAPFRLMALEARGAILLAAGERERAVADLEAVRDDALATGETVGRVTELLLAIGVASE